MDLEQLLKMLGVNSGAEAGAAISRFNMLVEGICAETGAESAQEAIQRVKQLRGSLTAIETAVGAAGNDALARVEAFKAQAERAKDLEGQLSGLQKAAEKKTAEDKIGQAIAEGRLAPAMRAKADELYAAHGLNVLESYLAAFDRPMFRPPAPSKNEAPRQPAPGTSGGQMSGDDDFTDEEREIMRVMNRTPEQMRAGRKLWNENAKGSSAFVPEAHVRALNEKTTKGARA